MECPLRDTGGAQFIIEYGSGTLAPENELAFQRHMILCSKCREIAEAQREVWSALDAWTPAPISQTFNQRLYRRIADEERSAWWQRLFNANWSWRPAMPVAAACAALIVAFLINNPYQDQHIQIQPAPAPQIEQVERALDDMDMLKQLTVTTSGRAASPSEKI